MLNVGNGIYVTMNNNLIIYYSYIFRLIPCVTLTLILIPCVKKKQFKCEHCSFECIRKGKLAEHIKAFHVVVLSENDKQLVT